METKWFCPSRDIFNTSMRNAESWKCVSVGKIVPFLVYIFPCAIVYYCLFVNTNMNTFLGTFLGKKKTKLTRPVTEGM